MVVATEKRPHGTELLVVPVTTRAPRAGDSTVEMPARVRQHIGLGDERCWIVADEVNSFTWPGPDIRPMRRGSDVDPRYGAIPGRLFDQVRQRLAGGADGPRESHQAHRIAVQPTQSFLSLFAATK
jgi:hypothetical protein